MTRLCRWLHAYTIPGIAFVALLWATAQLNNAAQTMQQAQQELTRAQQQRDEALAVLEDQRQLISRLEEQRDLALWNAQIAETLRRKALRQCECDTDL